MAQNGYGAAPVAGHVGRIPNFGKTQPMGDYEPPACIQNAMMTKDKKPFTYTPGGLDLSQIRTPSMARRMARQRSQEEHEQAYAQQHQANGGAHHQAQGGSVPPPPPPPIPVPPPPPALVIEVPKTKSPKPVPIGERPEIVIPENPIGMLRKTNSPYHWEAEKAEIEKLGNVPKFMEKVPSPLTVKMPPSSFSQQPPQNYTPQNNFQRQNYPYQSAQSPESPIHRPEAQYAHQKSVSPIVNTSPQTRENLVRQDSQFNKSPQPFAGQSPIRSGAPYSPNPNNNWRQPERRDSPSNNASNSTQSPPFNRGPSNNQQCSPNYQNQFTPPNTEPIFHTLPRVGQKTQGNFSEKPINNNVMYNNIGSQSPKSDNCNTAPWRSNTINRHPRGDDNQQNIGNNNNPQQAYSPPWNVNEGNNNNQGESGYSPPWKQENRNTVSNQQPQQQYTPPWVRSGQDSNNNRVQENNNISRAQDNHNNNRAPPASPPYTQEQNQPRYQSTMSIPVTPRKQNPQPEYNRPAPQKEVVYVSEEPVYYCPESPKSLPPWVKTQKEKTKTPPPAWCQRPLEGRKSAPRELTTPPRDANQEPEWIKKREEIRGGREVVSPPKYQQPVQPNWSTRPSENKKPENASQGSRVIPIQVEIDQGIRQESSQPPHLRLVIDMQPSGNQPFSPPTQRIMRVLSPQLVRLDDAPSQHELPTLNRTVQSQDSQPKTRIIPIQIEGGNGGTNKRVIYHKFTQEGPPRQWKAFKVLQIITGTEDGDDNMQVMENQHGFTDL